MSCRPAGKFLAVSGEFGPGKEPSLGQADCQIMPGQSIMGSLKDCCPLSRLTVWEFGLGEGTQLHPLKGPICRSRNRDLERGEATGPRSPQWDWSPAGQHQISLEPVMIFEVGQCPGLAQVHLEMDSLYSRCFAPNQSGRMWPSPCSFAFPLGGQAQSQGSGQPQLEGAGSDP